MQSNKEFNNMKQIIKTIKFRLLQMQQKLMPSKGVLIYLGMNHGSGFDQIFRDYKKAYGFEANPELYQKLVDKYKRYKRVRIINAAVTDFDGEVEFNIANNNSLSSSIGEIRDDWHNKSVHMVDKIKVPALNLIRFLKDENVKQIEMYVSDIQGMDLTVLKTLKPLIDSGRIMWIQTETAKDEYKNIYKGLSDNSLSGFRSLLGDNYELVATGWNGKLIEGVFDNVPEDWWEFDSMWKLKKKK